MKFVKITEVLVNNKRVYNGEEKSQAWIKYGEWKHENHTHVPITVKGWIRTKVSGTGKGSVKFTGNCGGPIRPPHDPTSIDYTVDMKKGEICPFKVSTTIYVQMSDNKDLLGNRKS